MINLSGGTVTTLDECSRELDHGPVSAVKTIDAIVVAQGRVWGGIGIIFHIGRGCHKMC